MKLILTRHGQTEDNVAGVTMGQHDSPLTEKGKIQAHAKADRLKRGSFNIDRIYTSDLGRSVTTANIIADDMGIDQIEPDKNLREISFGKYEELRYGSIPPRDGGYMTEPFPEGESNQEMAARVIAAVNKIFSSSSAQECVLVVTHSGPIAVILASFYQQDLRTLLSKKVGNDELLEIELSRKLENLVF